LPALDYHSKKKSQILEAEISLALILAITQKLINRNSMKNKFLVSLLLIGSLFQGNSLPAQTAALYSLPDSYRFDYEVDQLVTGRKNATDTNTLRFYYTKSGEYAAVSLPPKDKMKGNKFVVLTRDGIVVVMNEHKKSITIVSLRKMSADMMTLVKYIKIDSLMANMHRNSEGKEFQSVKTGNSRTIGTYTADEYNVSGKSNEKATIWCAKVDFNTQGDYLKGVIGVNFMGMMGAGQQHDHALMQTLMQPKTLVTSIETTDSTGLKTNNLQTVHIGTTVMTVATSGYSVNNYSDKTLPEIFQAEMKKRDN
jgi:hypothetical protein